MVCLSLLPRQGGLLLQVSPCMAQPQDGAGMFWQGAASNAWCRVYNGKF